MKKTTLVTAAVVGATAVAGAMLMKDKKNRDAVKSTANSAMKKVGMGSTTSKKSTKKSGSKSSSKSMTEKVKNSAVKTGKKVAHAAIDAV